ncbi:MAG TPA: subclass B1 metallo-beta-lactamase [Holophagaceae bacterium]|nr:subclass B1 metallo-beta-lactamase [Holophagaceae bacterium]
MPAFAPPALAAPPPGLPNALELAKPHMQRIGPGLWVAPLAKGVWVTSFTHRLDKDTMYPANGLVVDAADGAMLVDPGWEPAQAKALLAWAQRTLTHPVRRAIITHSHEDRSAGIAVLAEAGIPSYGLARTRELLLQKRRAPVEALPDLETKPWRGAGGLEVRFPGPGHAPDNLVVWVPSAKVLYGGCLLKSTTAPGLGNLEDADLDQWPRTMHRVREAYPDVRIQVPGHGTVEGDAIAHTLELLAAPR